MAHRTLRVKNDGTHMTIVLNRPDVLNAVNLDMMDELTTVLQEVEADDTVQGLVITGEGRAFCAGVDIQNLHGLLSSATALEEAQEKFAATLESLKRIPVPTVAAVNGLALAGGFELMLSCDMAVAAASARIGDQHLNYGLVGGPALYHLTRKVGYEKALEIVCTGRWLTGAEAANCGLVLRVVSDECLDSEVGEMMSSFSGKPMQGLRLSKRLVRASSEMHEQEALKLISQETRAYLNESAEPREGIDAFLAKRKPRFS